MSLNRRRNIYTLGDFQEKLNGKAVPDKDPFERDPFKVQSYNFRYAERPHAEVAVASRPRTTNNAQNSSGACQTYFYNYGFVSNNAANTRNSTSSANTGRMLNGNDFHECRRRKFLQDAGLSSRLMNKSKTLEEPKPYDSKISNVTLKANTSYTKMNSNLVMGTGYMQRSKTSCSLINTQNMNFRRNIQVKSSQTLQPQSHSRMFTTFSSPLSDINFKSKRSGSSCEININIKKAEDKSLRDNVNIKIETDSHKSLNLNSGSSKTNFQLKTNNKYTVPGLFSAETFVVDKKPLKYSTIGQEQSQGGLERKTNSERIKELNAIYGSQVLKKPPIKRNVISSERIPSRIPFGLSNADNVSNTSTLYANNTKLVKNSLFRSKSLLEKYKSTKPSISDCNAQKSTYNNLSSPPTKRLNAVRQTPRDNLSFGPKKSELKMTVPIRLGNSTKLPVNVNINVFAEKLKLLKA